MYVDIYNADAMMVFDSESTDCIGQSLQDLLSAKDFAKIQSGIDTKSSFTVSTRKASNHRQIVRYFTPIDAAGQTWWAASALTKTDLNTRRNYGLTCHCNGTYHYCDQFTTAA